MSCSWSSVGGFKRVCVPAGISSRTAHAALIAREHRVTVKARSWLVRYRVVLAAFLFSFFFEPSLVGAEGFGPFPVRNFHPIQQLVLNMPGDRAAVVEAGSCWMFDWNLQKPPPCFVTSRLRPARR